MFYQAVTGEKIKQMNRLADNQANLAKVDQRTYGKLPYAGYADKQAKADVATELASKEKMIALSKAELKAISGKRGLELAQKTVQSDRIKKQVEEVKNQQMMIAQYGKIGATIRQNAALAKTAMSILSPGTLLGAGVAGITVGKAVQEASPLHADTLTKSFDLLAAQLGTILLPSIDILSRALQDAAGVVGDFQKQFPGVGTTIASSVRTFLGGFFGPLGPLAAIISPPGAPKPPDRPATMPASFEAFDQAWRRIQQQAASTGDLEQQLLTLQMNNLPSQTAALQQIATNTAASPPPPQLPPGS